MSLDRPVVRRMSGRDPEESHRVATPLELLYDLCYAVAFGIAGSQFAHVFSMHHYRAALLAFLLALIAICWAWIQFSWFASAYDTDDWPYRVTVMVQMVGVVIVALGLPAVFHSIEVGHHLNISIMVAGYVVIRVAQLTNWLRVGRQSPDQVAVCRIYIITITISQPLWVVAAFAFAHVSLPIAALIIAGLMGIELTGPFIAETKRAGTPWHPHHIAERYSLLAIITLGEGVIGTVASVNAANADVPWTWEAIVLVVAGLLLTFGMWWVYFTVPAADILQRKPGRSFAFGYGHVIIFGAIAATGAGLHIAGATIEGAEHHVTAKVATLAVVAAVALYLVGIYLMFSVLTASFDPFHVLLLGLTVLVLAAALAMSAAGVALPWCLLTIAAALLVTVVGHEVHGRRYVEGLIDEM